VAVAEEHEVTLLVMEAMVALEAEETEEEQIITHLLEQPIRAAEAAETVSAAEWTDSSEVQAL
jgi:hypothetical protein